MQVNANIDESDVGRIRPGQAVTFRVDAWPGQEFKGVVAQVRLQPAVVQNVTTYSTIISVPNDDYKLKLGMTANLKVQIDTRADAIRVPNAALRFKPAIAAAPSTRTKVRNVSAGATADSTSTIWQLDATGALAPVRVQTGLTDGTRTQVSGTAVKEGMPIVVGANTGTTTDVATPASKNPLQPQSTGRRGGGPPGAF